VDRVERDLVVVHVVFGLVAVAVLLAPGAMAQGWRIAALVVVYHLASVAGSVRHDDGRWLRAWWFAAVLSVFQVIPDAVLAEGLGTLVFPPDGFPDIGPVTGFMAGLWTIPIVLIVMAADTADRRRGTRAGWLTAVVVAALVFASAEAVLPPLGIWEPVGVTTIGHVAWYVVPPELLLGAAAWWGLQVTRVRPPWVVVPVAAGVSLLYTGALAASWLLIERGLLGG